MAFNLFKQLLGTKRGAAFENVALPVVSTVAAGTGLPATKEDIVTAIIGLIASSTHTDAMKDHLILNTVAAFFGKKL